MRLRFLYGAALVLVIAGCTSPAAQHPITPAARQVQVQVQVQRAAAQGLSVLLVCNGSTAPCPALPHSAAPYYRTVQGAVDAARPGDWILIYPGVYHEKSKQ